MCPPWFPCNILPWQPSTWLVRPLNVTMLRLELRILRIRSWEIKARTRFYTIVSPFLSPLMESFPHFILFLSLWNRVLYTTEKRNHWCFIIYQCSVIKIYICHGLNPFHHTITTRDQTRGITLLQIVKKPIIP